MTRGLAVGVLVLGALSISAGRSAAAEAQHPLTLAEAVRLALSRDALVRYAHQAVEDARAAAASAGALTPRLTTSASNSASSSTGLDPESTITGTDYSSQTYFSGAAFPMPGGTRLGLDVSASTSTTNSALRTGEDMEFTYASASVGAALVRPIGLFRDERVLTEGGRWGAEIAVRDAELSLQEARRRVVAATATRFFAALRGRRHAEIAETSKQEAGELLRIAQAKLDRGKLAEIEVMEARVSADEADVALRKARSAAEAALDELRSFLGIALEEEVRLQHEDIAIADSPSLGEAQLVERAFAQRPDLQQLVLGMRLAELSLRRAEAASRPGLSLQAAYSRSGEADTIDDSFRDLVNPSWYVGLAATTSLSHSEDRAQVERARSALGLARLDEEMRRDEVRVEVRRLVREAADAAANAALLEETVKIAQENLHIRQVQFQHGLVRSIDVTQTERQLSLARVQLLDATLDHELALVHLSLAAGEMPAVARAAPPSCPDMKGG